MSNTRIITALVAFVATFIFSAGLVRIIFPAPVVNKTYCTDRSSNEIETFLTRDIRNGEGRMDNVYNDDARAVMDYWKTSSSMDAGDFPQDFQKAWREHMQAWRNYAEYLEEVKNNPAARKRNESGNFNREINRTWAEVLRIGRNYGAYVQ